MVLNDEKDRVVFGRRLPNELEAVMRALQPYRGTIRGIAVESTFNWYWLVDGLQEAGYRVHLVHTAKMEKYKDRKYEDDHSEAWLSAHLLRVGRLPTGYICPRERRGVRDLLRKRGHLVQQQTANILSLENIFARTLGCKIGAQEVRELDEETIVSRFQDANVALAGASTLRVVRVLQEQIRELEEAVLQQVQDDREFRLLKTISGVGQILGLTIWLETGEIGRFSSVGDYASYSRCVKSERWSNGRKKGEGNRKNGNRYLRWAYMEAAHYAVRYNPRARRFQQRKAGKTNAFTAWSALAHKLCRASYYVMRDQVAFRSQLLFG
jgi:transposase